MKPYVLEVFKNLSPVLHNKVDNFRSSTPDINGKIRTPEEEAKHLEKYCSDRDIKKWILVFEGEDLIGMTAVYGRPILYKAKPISLGGIGKVRVREDRRKKGLANIMMQETMKQLTLMKFDIAFLSTNLDSFLADYYKRYGFLPLGKSYAYSGISGKEYSENNGMIAPIGSARILQMILDGKEPLNIGRGNW
ncbi:GNAT family N-acetyltransferase [Candidatus Curtissbacteria bacterium]|nr:GNAT family N-acetyltransferase [Candidatus Curtissbacteria bacterium]